MHLQHFLLLPLATFTAGAAFGQVTMTDNAPGTFIDISATGVGLGLSDDEEVDILTTVGNALLPAGIVRVGSNGAVRFLGAGLDLAFTNGGIPSSNCFSSDQALCPFWDDINTGGGTAGDILWQEVGSVLVIQWEATEFYNSSDTVTFQLQVPASGPYLAQFIYTDIMQPRANGGGSATIGYQSGGYENDLQYSLNVPGTLMDGDVLSLYYSNIGTNYCNAVANTTGVPGEIRANGSSIVGNNDVTLSATNLPANQFGIFITSLNQGFVPQPGGSVGVLCLSGQIGRYNTAAGFPVLNSGASGAFDLQIDLSLTPTPNGPVAVFPGETWNFQAWYRDWTGMAVSNFTDGVSVQFQ